MTIEYRPEAPTPSALVFFLGGYDLETVAIRELLERHAPAQFVDHHLRWGAKASDYRTEIAAALDTGRTPVLVELAEDLALLPGITILVDHHGPWAGRDAPTALHQVFRLLRRPASEWTRWHELVAANDRGHIRGLRRVNATAEEIAQVRAADRRAQGITTEEEASGRAAVRTAEVLLDGRLTVVRLPHARTATVIDTLAPALGGPGFHNLLVLSPDAAHFFGIGAGVVTLDAVFPGGYSGGELPDAGFWGYSAALPFDALLAALARSLPP